MFAVFMNRLQKNPHLATITKNQKKDDSDLK